MCLCWRWGRCCKPCNDGSLLGPFQPRWWRTADSRHKEQCHGISRPVDTTAMQKDIKHTTLASNDQSDSSGSFACSRTERLNERRTRGKLPIAYPSRRRWLASQKVSVCRLAPIMTGHHCTNKTQRPIVDQYVQISQHNHTHWADTHTEPWANLKTILPLFNYVAATAHWFLMYQVMTALQYFWRQLWGLLREHTAWGCRPDRGELALWRRLLLSWLLSLQLTADQGCLLQRYEWRLCVGYLGWLLSPCFHLSYPCRGGMDTIMRQTLPTSIFPCAQKAPAQNVYIFLSGYLTSSGLCSALKNCVDSSTVIYPVSYQLCQPLNNAAWVGAQSHAALWGYQDGALPEEGSAPWRRSQWAYPGASDTGGTGCDGWEPAASWHAVEDRQSWHNKDNGNNDNRNIDKDEINKQEEIASKDHDLN